MNNDIVNYVTDVIHRQYEENGCNYCFSVYPEFYAEDDGLDVTGKRIVVAITPQGTFHFDITQGKAGWVSENNYFNNLNIMVHINAALITGHSVTQN